MHVIFLSSLSAAAKKPAKRKIPKAQLKKMQDGLKKYRAEMDTLREKAAKKAKITTKQYAAYLEALRSPECIAEGRTAGLKAAEIAKITPEKYKAFTKEYKSLRDAYKANKSKSTSSVMFSADEGADDEVKVSDETQKLLDEQFQLGNVLNVLQSDEFYEWYVGDFSSWLSDEESAPSADAIVKWLSDKLKA
jgi:hypothetical protein